MIGCKSGWLDGWAQVDYLPTGSYQISALLSRESRRENREPVSLIYYHSSDFSFFETFSRFAFLTLVMMGGGLMCPPKVFLFSYSKSLPQTKPLDPPVNS